MSTTNRRTLRTQLSLLVLLLGSVGHAEDLFTKPYPILEHRIERPLRYSPDGTDFVITNGSEFFNRPLYGGNTAFRVDAGDRPEFSLYLPGRGGNLRLGLAKDSSAKWLHECEYVVARYRPGAMLYEIRDAMLGRGTLHLEVLATRQKEALLIRAELRGGGRRAPRLDLISAFGGVSGERGRRSGDIGCEALPVSEFFQLRPDQCRGNTAVVSNNHFVVQGRPGIVAGALTQGSRTALADAVNWENAEQLLRSTEATPERPVVIGVTELLPGRPQWLALQRASGESASRVLERLAEPKKDLAALWSVDELPRVFEVEEQQRRAIANRVIVETPDPFINAAAAALNIAADAIWDERQSSFMHGSVAWRVRLLGWRGAYSGDALGWHERTRLHLEGYARQQNTNPAPAAIPEAEASANLSRNETALHSNGDMTRSHYDMNLVGIDTVFRHLLWTGDLEWAKRMWPVIQRHLAWEKRLFRREFGAERLPLYEAYACIWASDDLAYNGGGATHSSAYNYFHNVMAARIARLIGEDAAPYEQEAGWIAKAMRCELWLPDRGWFAEWKDLLGLQLVHPNAALWTFYHAVDSHVPTPLEAWQMTRFVDTQIVRIPMRGPRVPEGNFTIPTTSWMPYTWSLNNVVLSEASHTALAYWMAGRAEQAVPLFKGLLLDSMYLGLCPGNVGTTTYFDANRRESQRDFADGVGSLSRALIEGLFGVRPDLLSGELKLQPGFPAEWDRARITHPDFDFRFRRSGPRDSFLIDSRFARPVRLRLQVAARRAQVAGVTVNGRPATWRVLDDAVGLPRIEIEAPPDNQHEVMVAWKGKAISSDFDGLQGRRERTVERNEEFSFASDADVVSVLDPQEALKDVKVTRAGFAGIATGAPGHRTVFARVQQGAMTWWFPVSFEILVPSDPVLSRRISDWRQSIAPPTRFETVDLGSHFNDRVTQIFRNEYLSPRSPFCSLAVPKQGFGSWCHPADTFEVDDSGLRAVAAKSGGKLVLPNGVPLATPAEPESKNVVFTSQWDNYPSAVSVALSGKASHAYLLMTGSTRPMQSRFDNGEVLVTYQDGSTDRLPLHNPTTWWPIDQDYFIDDFAFRRPETIPPRVDLKTGVVRVLDVNDFKGKGRVVPGGAATVLDLPLNAEKELASIQVRALANEVVIGLMSLTLAR